VVVSLRGPASLGLTDFGAVFEISVAIGYEEQMQEPAVCDAAVVEVTTDVFVELSGDRSPSLSQEQRGSFAGVQARVSALESTRNRTPRPDPTRSVSGYGRLASRFHAAFAGGILATGFVMRRHPMSPLAQMIIQAWRLVPKYCGRTSCRRFALQVHKPKWDGSASSRRDWRHLARQTKKAISTVAFVRASFYSVHIGLVMPRNYPLTL